MTSNSIFVAFDNSQLCHVCEPYYALLALSLTRKVYDEISHGIALEVFVVALLRKVYDQDGNGSYSEEYAGRVSCLSLFAFVFVGRAAAQPEVVI
jgi:hypothetical protein